MIKTKITPRISETDGVGHINNTTIPVWFEAARQEIFLIFNPDLSFSEWRMVIVNMNVDYIYQIYYGTEVEIYTWVKKVGSKSLVLYQELYQNQKICSKVTAIYVNFNQIHQKSEIIPHDIRTKLEEHSFKE